MVWSIPKLRSNCNVAPVWLRTKQLSIVAHCTADPQGKGLKGDSSLGAAEREDKEGNTPDESTYCRLLRSYRWNAIKQTQAFEMAMNLLWSQDANTKIPVPKFMLSDIIFVNVLKKVNLKAPGAKQYSQCAIRKQKPHFTFVHLKATLAPNTSCFLSLQPQTAASNVCGVQNLGEFLVYFSDCTQINPHGGFRWVPQILNNSDEAGYSPKRKLPKTSRSPSFLQ